MPIWAIRGRWGAHGRTNSRASAKGKCQPDPDSFRSRRGRRSRDGVVRLNVDEAQPTRGIRGRLMMPKMSRIPHSFALHSQKAF